MPKIQSNRILDLLMLSTVLVFLSGCASNAAVLSSNKEMMTKQTVTYAVADPIESAILSQVPAMRSGTRGTAGSVSFSVGDIYTAASGRQCKPVAIIAAQAAGGNNQRLACNHNNNWFFSKDILMRD
jgi:hypothetical protein